jgi:hypothetical protein
MTVARQTRSRACFDVGDADIKAAIFSSTRKMDYAGLISEPHAYIPPAETRRVFAWASSGRSERMPSQFFSNWA